jgi:hypothetical protein
MPKALSLLIVFLGVAVGSFAQTTTTFPKVVATFNRLNQTAAIPTTTIYTPPKGGLFRITIYGAIVKAHGTGPGSRMYSLRTKLSRSGLTST